MDTLVSTNGKLVINLNDIDEWSTLDIERMDGENHIAYYKDGDKDKSPKYPKFRGNMDDIVRAILSRLPEYCDGYTMEELANDFAYYGV